MKHRSLFDGYCGDLWSFVFFRHGPRKKQSDVHDNSAADLDLSSGLERAPLYARGEFYR